MKHFHSLREQNDAMINEQDPSKSSVSVKCFIHATQQNSSYTVTLYILPVFHLIA